MTIIIILGAVAVCGFLIRWSMRATDKIIKSITADSDKVKTDESKIINN